MKKYFLSKPKPLVSISSTCGENKKIDIDTNLKSIKSQLMLSREQERRFSSIITKYDKLRKNTLSDLASDSCTMLKMSELIKKQNTEVSLILKPEQYLIYNTSIQKIEDKLYPPGYSDALLELLIKNLRLDDEKSIALKNINKAFEKFFFDAQYIYLDDETLSKEYWNMYDTERKCAIKLILSEYQYLKYLKLVASETYKGEAVDPNKKTKYNLC